jgi:hypothetical protein
MKYLKIVYRAVAIDHFNCYCDNTPCDVLIEDFYDFVDIPKDLSDLPIYHKIDDKQSLEKYKHLFPQARKLKHNYDCPKPLHSPKKYEHLEPHTGTYFPIYMMVVNSKD